MSFLKSTPDWKKILGANVELITVSPPCTMFTQQAGRVLRPNLKLDEDFLHEPGSILMIDADGTISTVNMHNDVGGTIEAPEGKYRVTVVRSWWDYETGNRYVGAPLMKDAEALYRSSYTPHAPKVPNEGFLYFGQDAIIRRIK